MASEEYDRLALGPYNSLFCFVLETTSDSARGLLLAVHSGIAPGSTWGPYEIPGIKPRSPMC